MIEQTDKGLWEDIKDAVSARTVGLVLGVLLIQLAFVASYVGAFHKPTPHDVAVGVVAPAQQAAALKQQLRALSGHPLAPEIVEDRATAVARIKSTDLAAALVVDPSSTTDELLVASGGGASLVTALELIANRAEAQHGRTVTVTDIVPLQAGDARGLTGFYLVIGWLVGGYLVASLLGVAKGARPATPRRAAIRLGATVPYALLSGLGGAFIVDQWLGALAGHFWALWGVGALLVLSAATVTMAFQTLFGTIGIGLTVLLFVVLGNPSAGGAYQTQMLPSLWRGVGGLIPNGAGTEAVRRIVYFDAHGVASRLWVIVAYIAVGVLVTAGASLLRARRERTAG
jgi:hypothetical protein